jgi:hypothetical protein
MHQNEGRHANLDPPEVAPMIRAQRCGLAEPNEFDQPARPMLRAQPYRL